MKTKRITSPLEAAEILMAGGLVAFPTETVFGLGADATNPRAIERLFAAKGRPGDNPLIAHVSEIASWRLAASELTPAAEAILGEFAPGPLTVVLPKQEAITSLATAGLTTVGVRVPDHPIASEVLRLAGVPVAAPSANRSGRPSCTTWESVLEDLDGRIDAVYCDNTSCLGIESTVIDCTGHVPTVLRPGAVTLEQLRCVLPNVRSVLSQRLEHPDGPPKAVRSPGTLHPHYQPHAKVSLVDRPPVVATGEGQRLAYCGLESPLGIERLGHAAVYSDVDTYAAGFYEFLREADRKAVEAILVQRAPPHGIGVALIDRQVRAAGESG